MMTSLLVIREYIKNFYVKYEEYIEPFLKFMVTLITLSMINGKLGYMQRLNNMTVVLVVSLVCSFMPLNTILLFAAGFIILHVYQLSIECALVVLVILLLLFLLYFRFSPRSTILVLLTPMLFFIRIPYVAPIAAGLMGNPVSAITVACGVLVYYMIEYISKNAAILTAAPADSMMQKITDVLSGIFDNKALIIVIAAFAVTVILVYLIRRLSVNYAWTIAIIAGSLVDIVILLIGDLIYDANFSILGVIIGSMFSIAAAVVIEFFRFNLDYSRTEKVQFEDDEYYYYVKAVPKMMVATPEKKVKKITTQRPDRYARHTHGR